MKSPTKTVSDDGPEEGEIVSDDLEDISDESIVFTLNNGKSLSRNGHLHALSLSSVSEWDEHPTESRRKRKKSYSRRGTRQKKKKMVNSDSSDNDSTVDSNLKLQLKAAVRVDIEEAHRNSLRTRLRAMAKSGSLPEPDVAKVKHKSKPNDLNKAVKLPDPSIAIIDLVEQDAYSCLEILGSSSENAVSAPENNESASENIDSASEQLKVDDIDNELIQLRLEALRTAINNKFANRRKRKKENSSDDTNKENTSNNSEEIQCTNTPSDESKTEQSQISPVVSSDTKINTPTSPDEDEDVLRALLLASMSKKITRAQPEPSTLTINEIESRITIINQNKIKNNNFKLNNNIKNMPGNVRNVNNSSTATKLIKMPQVKPLIINLNSDSDSDWDLETSPEKSPKKAQNNPNLKVVKNLETVMGNPIKPVDPDSVNNDIESTVEKFLKEQRAKVESKASKRVVKTSAILPTNSTLNKLQIALKTSPSIRKVIPHTIAEKPKVQKPSKLEKSALKFLPANKRAEYQKLQKLLVLKEAQKKKPKVRRISQKISDNGNNLQITAINKGEGGSRINEAVSNNIDKELKIMQRNLMVKKNIISHNVQIKNVATSHSLMRNNSPAVVFQAKQNNIGNCVKRAVHNKSTQTIRTNDVPAQVKARIEEFKQQELKAVKIEQERKNETVVMRANLKMLQSQKDGRFQMEEKYRNLGPLVTKLNEMSKEHKMCEQEVKRLLAELKETREKQEILHKDISASIKEIVEEKKKIDLSLSMIDNKSKPSVLITSTPIKPSSTITFLSPNLSVSSPILCSESNDVTELQTDLERNNLINMVNTWDESTICNNCTQKNNDAGEAEVVDPNDIDNVIRETEERMAKLETKESFVPRKSDKVKYVSPLDVGQRKGLLNPFGIMCPFEVNGTCKDPDCDFNHLPK